MFLLQVKDKNQETKQSSEEETVTSAPSVSEICVYTLLFDPINTATLQYLLVTPLAFQLLKSEYYYDFYLLSDTRNVI